MHKHQMNFCGHPQSFIDNGEENRTSHLHPSIQYACDSTHLYGTDSCWVDSSTDLLHRILTLSEEN